MATFNFLGLLVVNRGRFRNWFNAGLGFLGFGENVLAWPGRLVGPEGRGSSLVGPTGRDSSS